MRRTRPRASRPARVHAGRGSSAGANTLDILIGDCPGIPGGIATCSDGWTGKVNTSTRGQPTAFTIANPIGALTAAALTAGEAFLRLIGVDRPPRAFELSAWTGYCGPLGSLPAGPRLPTIAPIDALLIGCGNVMNGWAAAVRALQITGHARAVDRESLGEENLGPYAFARRDMIGQPKTALLAGHLEPLISVTRHDEELDLFVPRITRWHLPLPALVINGLNEVEPRHVVQRLWPEVLIDMAAGGMTSRSSSTGGATAVSACSARCRTRHRTRLHSAHRNGHGPATGAVPQQLHHTRHRRGRRSGAARASDATSGSRRIGPAHVRLHQLGQAEYQEHQR
jgi:hypothetical protein